MFVSAEIESTVLGRTGKYSVLSVLRRTGVKVFIDIALNVEAKLLKKLTPVNGRGTVTKIAGVT